MDGTGIYVRREGQGSAMKSERKGRGGWCKQHKKDKGEREEGGLPFERQSTLHPLMRVHCYRF